MIGFFKVQHLFFSHKKKFPLVCSFFIFLSSIFLISFLFVGGKFDIIIVSSLSVINFFFGLKWKINKVSLDFVYIIKIKRNQLLFWPEFRSLFMKNSKFCLRNRSWFLSAVKELIRILQALLMKKQLPAEFWKTFHFWKKS